MATDKLQRQFTFDGRSARVYEYDRDSNATTLLIEGQVKNAEWGEDEFTLLFNDRMAELDVPFQPSRFLGTAVGTSGIEGASELTGALKPVCFGKCLNVTPALLNSSTLVYGVNFDVDGYDFTLTNDVSAKAKNPTGEFPVQMVVLDRTTALSFYNHDDSGDGLFVELIDIDRGTATPTPSGVETTVTASAVVWAHAVKLDDVTALVVYETTANVIFAAAVELDRTTSPDTLRVGTSSAVATYDATATGVPTMKPRVAVHEAYGETGGDTGGARLVFIQSGTVEQRNVTVTHNSTTKTPSVALDGAASTVATETGIETVDIVCLATEDNLGAAGEGFGICYGKKAPGTGFLGFAYASQSVVRNYGTTGIYRTEHARLCALYNPATTTQDGYFSLIVAFRAQATGNLHVATVFMDTGGGGATNGGIVEDVVFSGVWGHPELTRLSDERVVMAVMAHNAADPIMLSAIWSNGSTIRSQTPEPISDNTYQHGSIDVLSTDEPAALLIGATDYPTPATVRAITVDANPAAQPQPVGAFDKVYDKGLALTAGANYRNISDLEGSAPTPGTYNTCLNSGCFILGASPSGRITADVSEHDAVNSFRFGTAADIVKRILMNPHRVGAATDGKSSNASLAPIRAASSGSGALQQIDTDSFGALGSDNDAVVGIYVTEDATVLDVCQAVLNSVGASLAANKDGFFIVPRFEAPAISAAAEFTARNIIAGSFRRLVSGDPGAGIPAHKIDVGFERNFTQQFADELAGSVPDAEAANSHGRTFLAEPWRYASQLDASVLRRHRLAPHHVIEALFANEADAEVEAERLAILYGKDRGPWQIAVQRDDASAIDIGSTIKVTHPRFGFDGGVRGFVTGITELYGVNETVLEFWT